jgi:two-component system sensor histidine kinase CpxA
MTQPIPARAAVDTLVRYGDQRLREHLDSWQRSAERRAFLFDDTGREAAGQAVPGPFEQLAARARRTGTTEVEQASPPLAAYPVQAANGRTYVYVTELPPPDHAGPFQEPSNRPGPASRPEPGARVGELPGDPPGPAHADRPAGGGPPARGRPPSLWPVPVNEPQRLALVILVVVITGGAVCYWLARSLTAPLERLRQATTRLAEGDLSVRLGRAIENRRDEIGDLGRDFDRMAERLEALIANERRLLRDVSHELRSPLARLNIALGIARQQAQGEVTDSLDRIEYESDRLAELIDQLLTLARLEGGLQQDCACELELNEVVRQVVEDARFEARNRGVEVDLATGESCPTTGSAELLRRAVENVVRNAVCYTAERSRVEVSIRRTGTSERPAAEIRVRDHGPGVPDAALLDVFRPFYRVEAGRERNRGGLGLGLAITDRAVRAHGGTIAAAHAPGGPGDGLVITMTLPLREVAGQGGDAA